MSILRVQAGIDGNKGRGKHALPKEILQNVRNAEGCTESVGGIGIAKIVCKDAITNEPDQAAQQDTCGDRNCVCLS